MQNNYDVVVSANMPNAGHTAYDEFGQKWVHKVLPSGIFSEDLKYVGVGAGAIFSIDRLEEEWKQLCERIEDGPTLIIHEAAGILLPEHKEAEQVALTQISSTMQGSGAALCDKVMRKFGVIAAHHRKEIMERLNQYGRVNILNSAQWAGAMGRAKRVLVEGSQGYSLGISAGFYPYCTSRDCTPARVMADCGVMTKWKHHGENWGLSLRQQQLLAESAEWPVSRRTKSSRQ
jgi:adenylosuccinate synthase